MSNIVVHDRTDNNIVSVSPTVIATLKNRNYRPNFSLRPFCTQFSLIKSAFCPTEQFLSTLKEKSKIANDQTKNKKLDTKIADINIEENISPLDLEIADFASPIPQIFPIVNPVIDSSSYNQPLIVQTDNEIIQTPPPVTSLPIDTSTPLVPPSPVTPPPPTISSAPKPVDASSPPSPIPASASKPAEKPTTIEPAIDQSPPPSSSSLTSTAEELDQPSDVFQVTPSKGPKSAFSRRFSVALTLSLTAAIAFFGFYELTANIKISHAQEPLTSSATVFASTATADDTSEYYQPGLAPTPRSSTTTPINHAAALALSQFHNLETSFNSPSTDKLQLRQSFIASSAIPVPNIAQLRIQSSVFNSNALKPVAPPAATFDLKRQNLSDANDLALSVGEYQYAISFVTFDGQTYRETTPSETVSLSVTTPNSAINISQIPLYSKSNIVARRIYRTRADGSELFFLTELEDSSVSSYLDTTPDINLTTPAPTTNTTAAYQYRISFFTANAQTTPSEPVAFLPSLEQGEASLTNIPLDPTDQARGRRIYRTMAGGEDFYLVGQLNNNQSTVFNDSVSDLVLATREKL